MGKKKTQEQFEKDVLDRLGDQYELLSPYPGGHGQVKMRHLTCGNEFMKNVHDIISKSSGCPFCNGAKPAKYNEQWVKNNTPLPYHYVSDYNGMKQKCLFYCDNCKTTFLQQPSRLIIQHIFGCNCCPTKHKTHEQFLLELGADCLNEYEILSKYINMDTKIKIKHNKCGCEFEITPYRFIYRHNKQYCPICYYKKSHGEMYIENFLINNNIDYQREFIFPDLPQRRFDFYLPELSIAIEFDGMQHYKPIEFFGGEEAHKKLIAHDIEKNQYCINNNIILFRIPYDELDNIYTILTQIFKEKGSTTIEKFQITEQSRK